jgi:phosphocarrier protein
MYSEETTVVNATGLHARPAATFSKAAAKFASDVQIGKAEGDTTVNAKSMLALMSQGLSCGTKVRISADGADEQEAVKALVEVINSGCGE